MKQLNVKKLVLLNLPYILLGLFATNLGEAWRLAAGADVSAKMLSFFSTLPVALGSWWPSPVSYTHLSPFERSAASLKAKVVLPSPGSP